MKEPYGEGPANHNGPESWTGAERTVEQQDPRASSMRKGRSRKVHSLIDKVYSRKNLEMAWQKVKENRGSASIDEVTTAKFEERKGYYLDLLHRKPRDGTYRPKPVKWAGPQGTGHSPLRHSC